MSWDVVRKAGIADSQYSELLHCVGSGSREWSDVNKVYERHVDELSVVDGVVTYRDRIVIPHGLREEVLRALHRAHQGSTNMALRAAETVWWPGLSADIARVRDNCVKCRQNAPSQRSSPPTALPVPEYPFQMLSSDYFAYSGRAYVVFVDRYSGWPVVLKCKDETSEELIRHLRNLFCVYGVPEELASDGAQVYVSDKVRKFLALWGVSQRVSTAYNPHSNLRAETCVKTIKRLIASNTGAAGTLDTDGLAAALLTYRNTPDRDTGLSPAQVLFARKLRDTVPVSKEGLKLRPDWVLTLDRREEALAKRHKLRGEELSKGTQKHVPLVVGQAVQVQNQRGPHANKWDLSGTITEVTGFDSYVVRMDGSGRVTRRNRQYLKPIRTYMEIVREGEKLRSNKFNSTSGTGDTSARGGNSGSGPPPMSVPLQLVREQPVPARPATGSSAVARGQENQSPGGPRNTVVDKSSSPDVRVEEIQIPNRQTDVSTPMMIETDVSSTVEQQSPPVSMDQVHSVVPQIPVPSNGQYVRPKRITRAPDRLIVGDPSHPRFNRTMQ